MAAARAGLVPQAVTQGVEAAYARALRGATPVGGAVSKERIKQLLEVLADRAPPGNRWALKEVSYPLAGAPVPFASALLTFSYR